MQIELVPPSRALTPTPLPKEREDLSALKHFRQPLTVCDPFERDSGAPLRGGHAAGGHTDGEEQGNETEGSGDGE
jgi:hypothetical protein